MKNNIRIWVVLAITFVVYTVIAFAPPFEHTTVFWLSYVFAAIAILVQFYVMYSAFMKGEGAKSKFYGFPIARIGVIYMVLQMVLSLVMMAIGANVETWISLIAYVVLLSVAAFGFISADTVREEVQRQEGSHKQQIAVIRSLQAKVSTIASICKSDAKQEVAKLAEEFRFSDPVSNDAALQEIEAQLTICLDKLQVAVTAGNDDVIRDLCRETSLTLAERNRLCKLSK